MVDGQGISERVGENMGVSREHYATGGQDADDLVLLQCGQPGCFKTKKIPVDESMPAGTAVILSNCPEHYHTSEVEIEEYLDHTGKRILLIWYGTDWVIPLPK